MKVVNSVVLGLCCGLLLAACGSDEVSTEEMVRPVPTLRVGDVGELERRNFPGRARASQEVELSFRVKGPLITLPILVGAPVKKGDVMARIDPRDFEVQLRNAQGQLQRTQANLDRADSEYRRLQGIRKKDPDLVSEVHLERARESFELAKADSSALQATVDAAQDELDYTYLKAPFDGVIVATYVENFEYVQARQAVARLVDRRRIEFVFQVPETLISLISMVEDLKIRFDAFPDHEVNAAVLEVGTEASSLTRTYPVTLIMNQPDNIEILPGMAGTVMGVARDPKNKDKISIVIPVSAVFSPSSGGLNYVWLVDEDSKEVSKSEIQIGQLVSGGMEVKSGLKVGELIATAGVNFLSEGQKVRLLEE
jgi:RND family efflux transporter MFP subunit